MKRKIRHILPRISVVLVVFVAIFMVVPRDVCIARLVADSCQCLPSEKATSSCACCKPGKSVMNCCNDNSLPTAPADDTTETSNFCFSISSDLSQLKSAERIQTVDIADTIIAMLPLSFAVVSAGPVHALAPVSDLIPGRDELHLHRENCVFII